LGDQEALMRSFGIAVVPILLFALLSGPLAAEEITLSLDVRKARETGGEEGATPSEEIRESRESLTLAPKKFAVQRDQETMIYDFVSERIFILTPAKRTVLDTSLYWVPTYKLAERANRRVLNGFYEELGLDNEGDSDFELEALFSSDPNTPVGAQIQIAKHGETTQFVYNKEEVASYGLANQQVPADLAGSFRKYFLYCLSVHPKILETLLDTKHFFDTLTYVGGDGMPVQQTTTIKADKIANSTAAALSVPHSFKTIYSSNNRLNAVIEAAHSGTAPTIQQYERQLENAGKRGDALGVFLIYMEAVNQIGTNAATTLGPLVPKATGNATDRSYIQDLATAISKPPASEEEARSSIGIIEAARKKAGPRGAILDVFTANYYGMLGDLRKAEGLILTALEKNPFLTGAYKDLGDKYYQQYDMVNAWAAWDQMLRIGSDHELAKPIEDLKVSLREEHPAYFQ